MHFCAIALRRRLTALCSLAALGLGACASLGATRRIPNAADSLLALTVLNATLVNHTRRVLQNDAKKRLAIGARLDRLPNLYSWERREGARYARQVQSDLESIAYDALTQDDYLSLLAVHWELGIEAEAPIYRTLDFSAAIPGASPIPAIARALAQHPIERAQDVERYFYLLDNLALFFPELRANLAEQAKTGMTIPRAALDSVAAYLLAFRQPAVSSPFTLSAERLTRIDSVSRAAVLSALSAKIEGEINPQIDSLVSFIQAPYAAASDSSTPVILGLSQYPGGREYYLYLLRRHTTLEVVPGDLFANGLREVERVAQAMAALRGKLGFTGSDSAFRATLHASARYRIESPNEFEAHAQRVYRALRDSIQQKLGIAVADSLHFARRAPRAFDGAWHVSMREADGIDPYNRLEYVTGRITRLPAYLIPALVARELVPGRLAMISAIQSNDSLPTLRHLMRFAGSIEGWSEHARGLAGELGLYGDSVIAYGALMLELEATARMVTDLGLHHLGWPQPEAVRYLRQYAVDPSTAEGDVLRMALAEPGRAVAMKVGSREFAGLRAWVRRELGAQYDDAALQREILRVGVLPLPLLGQHLAWWVWKTKSTEQGARSK